MQRTAHPSSQSASSTSELADDLRKALVLVVDPDASARSVLEVVLVRDGFDVWSTGSGSQGLALMKSGRTPDVIVLESDLGGEDGFSFVSQVRGDAKTAAVPVLLLARQDDENVANMAEVVGVDDFVQKPAFARDISALVRLELAKVQGTGEIKFQAGQLNPAHLLRALLSCPRSGRLVLAEGRASIEFHQGQVVDARFGKVWGINALVRALVLTSGEWSLVLGSVAQGNVFQCSLRELVQVVLPRVHAWEHVLLRSVPIDARLAVDFFRLSKSLASMPADVNRIVQLFDGQRTVRQVLLDSDFDESMTLEVATRLYLMGIVLPAKGGHSEVQMTAPRLFEPQTEAPRSDSGEWYQVTLDGSSQPQAAGVDENDGGWTATALGDTRLAEMAPDVAKQIEAFNIRIEVEPREVKRPQRTLKSLAKGADPVVMVELPVVAPKVTAAPMIELGEEPQTPVVPMARHFDRQERIVTPTLTPAISDADMLEASFFANADSSATRIGARPATVELTLAAAAQADVGEGSDAPVESRSLPIGLFVLGGLSVLILAVGFEFLMKPVAVAAEPVVAVAPVVAAVAPVIVPDIEEPEFYEDVPATVIDVQGPLTEARRMYEQGLYKESISMLEQIISDEPNSVEAWVLMGKARFDANDSKGAREAADKVLALDPSNAGVQMLLASFGDKASAKAALQKYLELAPTGPYAEEAKALLAR